MRHIRNPLNKQHKEPPAPILYPCLNPHVAGCDQIRKENKVLVNCIDAEASPDASSMRSRCSTTSGAFPIALRAARKAPGISQRATALDAASKWLAWRNLITADRRGISGTPLNDSCFSLNICLAARSFDATGASITGKRSRNRSDLSLIALRSFWLHPTSRRP
jgi:hypothetical protein